MEHIRIDRNRKSEVENSIAVRNTDHSVGNRNRHGPSTRGDPDIRGKPPFIKCANTKIRQYINVPIRGRPPLVWCSCVLIRGKSPLEIASRQQGFVISTFSVILSSLSRYLGIVEGSLLNEVAPNNMRFPIELGMTARGKPGYWLHKESRVLAAIKSDD